MDHSGESVREYVLSEAEISPIVAALTRVRDGIGKIPGEFLSGKTENPHDVAAFDPNEILNVFDSLKIRAGYVLDYVYAYTGTDGRPCLYARKAADPPINSMNEYQARHCVPRCFTALGQEPGGPMGSPYLSHLEYESTPMGCFQFALFCMVIPRFYRFWHANYNNRHYLFSREELERAACVESADWSEEEARIMRDADPAPKVAMADRSARVRMLTHEINRGFSYMSVDITSPNIFRGVTDEVLVESKMRIRF